MVDQKNIINVTNENILECLQQSQQAANLRSRILVHDTTDNPIQEMLIVLDHNSYVMPHRQLDRIKSYILISGKMRFLVFDDAGNITETSTLSDSAADNRIIRFDSSEWHTVVPISDNVIYVEIAQGSYHGSSWAPWAPNGEVKEDYLAYMEKLRSF